MPAEVEVWNLSLWNLRYSGLHALNKTPPVTQPLVSQIQAKKESCRALDRQTDIRTDQQPDIKDISI